jgi:GMP synthase (glutamine-hydrolysing)
MAASRTCFVIGHVAFEDLDLLAPIIAQRGYEISYLQAGVDRIDTAELKAADLLVVLGGPIGVYEADTYPFIRDEIAAIRARLDADKPILGICLGAQLMAAALGARVAPGPVKEIGWAPVALTEAGERSVLATLATTPVLHWHGDNCELPVGCERLASTEHCPVQAFSRRPWQLALQFHLEVDGARFERWLIGHTVEIGKAGLDPNALRTQARTQGAATVQAGRAVFSSWLQSIDAVVAG